MKTGWQSVKLALAGFIVPFMFVYNPQLLLEKVTLLSGIQVVVTSCVGVLLIAAAVEGYLRGRMNVALRVVAAAGALLLIEGGGKTDLLGKSGSCDRLSVLLRQEPLGTEIPAGVSVLWSICKNEPVTHFTGSRGNPLWRFRFRSGSAFWEQPAFGTVGTEAAWGGRPAIS